MKKEKQYKFSQKLIILNHITRLNLSICVYKITKYDKKVRVRKNEGRGRK